MTGGAQATEGELAQGLFVQPTIFANVHNEMRLAQEEVFGPVLSIIPFETEEEAIRSATTRATAWPRACGHSDVARVHRVSRALRTGIVWVNTYRQVGGADAVRRCQGFRLRP